MENVIVVRNTEDYNNLLSTNILMDSFNVYCRVSTVDQITNTSLDNQMELGISYCRKNITNYKYIIVWREEGKSGDDFVDDDEDIGEMVKRELLNIIMDNWRSRITKNIWVWDLSRLSRNDEVSQLIKGIIYKNGIDLYLNTQKYNFDNKMDKLLFGVLSLVNEFENHQRFEKGLMGKRKNLDLGKWWGGTVPLGLKTVDGFVVEDEKNSKWVKKMYEWSSKGLSTQKICERLEKIGIKTQRNQSHWNPNSVRVILKNTFYIGYKDYEVKGLKGKSKEYCRDRGLTYKHKFKCESMISKELYEEVQKQFRNRNGFRNQKNTYKFLFKGLIYCGGCGVMMRGRQTDSKGENSYRCVSSEENWRDSRTVKCEHKKSVHRVGLEEIVWLRILNTFKDSELIREEFRTNNLPKEYDEGNTKKKIKSNLNKIKVRVRKLEDIEVKRGENIGKNVISKISDVQLQTILNIIDNEEKKITTEIEEFKLKNELLENSNIWEDWFTPFTQHFNKICKIKDFEGKRKFVNDFVERIDVDWNENNNTHNIKIHFKLNIVKDRGELIGKDIYKIKKGKKLSKINDINVRKIHYELNKKSGEKPLLLDYSTVTEWSNSKGFDRFTTYTDKYNSLVLNFTLSFKTSNLTKTSHYNEYQQKLYDEVKRLKEVEGLGYRRISYILYEKGYRSVRTNSVLKNNYIYSIYKKGKIRENRIERTFESNISNIMVYEDL